MTNDKRGDETGISFDKPNWSEMENGLWIGLNLQGIDDARLYVRPEGRDATVSGLVIVGNVDAQTLTAAQRAIGELVASRKLDPSPDSAAGSLDWSAGRRRRGGKRAPALAAFADLVRFQYETTGAWGAVSRAAQDRIDRSTAQRWMREIRATPELRERLPEQLRGENKEERAESDDH